MLVVIEGLDGSGKTSQSKILLNNLIESEYDAVYVRPIYFLLSFINPNGNNNLPSPRKLRTVQKSHEERSILKILPMSLIGYFYALATYVFLKIYYRKKIIVCDRYFYQFFFDIFYENSAKIINYFPKPDIGFYLSGNLNYFYTKMSSPFDRAVNENYYKSLEKFYEIVCNNHEILPVNAKDNKEEIARFIFNKVIEKVEDLNHE